jgi:hypothetical protein
MRSAALVLIVLSLASPALAQSAAAQEPAKPVGTTGQSPDVVDVDRLPLDLKRIQRGLQQTPTERVERDGLNLRYQLQIYGTAPPIQFFGEDANLVHGPVPYGAPTHQEIINHITPLPFRAPAADFSALIRWLADRNKKK